MAQNSRMNTDNKSTREIDLVNAPKDELIEYLCQTIHYEVEKGEDADCDLIRECSDWLEELTADEIVFSPEELEAKLEAIKNGKNPDTSEIRKHYPRTSIAKRKIFVRVTILVASLVLLSFLSLSALAMHEGYNSTWEYVVTNVNKLFGLETGEQINADGISFIKYSESIYYSNMTELLTNENIDILYPHSMPHDIKIIEISRVDEFDGKYILYFSFSNKAYVINVSNYFLSDPSSLDGFKSITINDINCFYTMLEENRYYALLQYNGYEYTIQCPSYADLLIILNNMKG